MPIDYSCFISYSHNSGALSERLIHDLYEALSNEIGPLLRDKNIIIDWERLKGGDFYNEVLSKSLCKSACMIMVFTPTYFDRNHTFCAREFKAMEELETKRFQMMGSPSSDHGLIIPIIFRGSSFLPSYIKSRRQYYNFENYRLVRGKENILSTHVEYQSRIKEIAGYIHQRYLELNARCDIINDCREFNLPSEHEILPWIDENCSITIPFPGR